MNLKNFVDGVAIIRAFYVDPDGYQLAAEHDQIYLYATTKPMDEDSVTKLREIGWFQVGAVNDGKGDVVYDPSASWSAFV